MIPTPAEMVPRRFPLLLVSALVVLLLAGPPASHAQSASESGADCAWLAGGPASNRTTRAETSSNGKRRGTISAGVGIIFAAMHAQTGFDTLPLRRAQP